MADVEFEEFCRYCDDIPQHIKASARSYTLVHDILIDEDVSHNTDHNRRMIRRQSYQTNGAFEENSRNFISKSEYCDSNYLSRRNYNSKANKNMIDKRNKRIRESEVTNKTNIEIALSLADEFEFALADTQPFVPHDSLNQPLTQTYLNDTIYSPDSELCDSGNSTDDSLVPGSADGGSNDGSLTHLELLEATHRALYKFIARHSDELELDIGDPIYVQKEAEDLWCEGINLRNGNRGIFPSAYVVDVEYNDFDPSAPQAKRERFVLRYLGSVETLYHKGNSVLCQAVQKVLSTKSKCYLCILEVSDQGLKMYDHMKPSRDIVTKLDYFYSLKNVSFCGFHPHDSRLMGFITKHPRCDRFACHVFQSDDSTRPVTESIGTMSTDQMIERTIVDYTMAAESMRLPMRSLRHAGDIIARGGRITF